MAASVFRQLRRKVRIRPRCIQLSRLDSLAASVTGCYVAHCCPPRTFNQDVLLREVQLESVELIRPLAVRRRPHNGLQIASATAVHLIVPTSKPTCVWFGDAALKHQRCLFVTAMKVATLETVRSLQPRKSSEHVKFRSGC